MPHHNWTLTHSDNSFNQITYKPSGEKWAAEALLLSDLHFDNPHCDRDLLKTHLDEAVAKNAPIIVAGDFFCAMQGKGDLRGSKADVRPEHNVGNYLDSIVTEAVNWWQPYKQHLAIVGKGNHETGVLDRKEVDLIGNFGALMRASGGITQTAGYASYIKLSYLYNRNNSKYIYMHHGYGGGSQATRSTNHWMQYIGQVEADVYIAGHTHWKEHVPYRRAYCTTRGRVNYKDIHCLRLGTYKDEYRSDDMSGYHHVKGRGPRPLGGWWMIQERQRHDVYFKFAEC